MGNLAHTIPFTELWERLLLMARIDSPNNEDYARGIINDIYTRTLPRLEDWDPIVAEGSLATTAKYSTGSVSVTAGDTAITGVGTTWTSGMTAADGYKIKIAGNDNVYTFTHASGTTGTISPALSGNDVAGAGYTIFRDTYELASDFDRFLKNGSIYVYSGGRVSDVIKESKRDVFREEFSAEVSDPIRRSILWDTHATTGNRRIRINPPPSESKLYPYEYIKMITPMSDYLTGYAAVTNASTTVTGTDTLWLANASAGDYFRVDGNGTGSSSKWYQIASVDSDVQLTLSTAYGEATESSMEYTVSSAPTAFPKVFHEFILYEGILTVVGEQGDPTLQGFVLRRGEILLDIKKNYKTRDTNVQIGFEDGGYRNSWR